LRTSRDPFPHQTEALTAWWGAGGRGVVVLPTGTGKTHLAVMAISKYFYANLDVGHYTAAGGDAVAFIKTYHDRITNLHFKDMVKNQSNSYKPFGQGDAPLKDVLLLMAKEKWNIPVNIEFEYPGDPMVEIPKCFQFIKDALA
jgi:sugar phosphate isomerase/epimerase